MRRPWLPRIAARTGVRAAALLALVSGVSSAALSCAAPPQHKKLEMVPFGAPVNEAASPGEPSSDPGASASSSPVGATVPVNGGGGAAGPCTGSEVDLEATLGSCEVPMPKSGELPSGMKDKIEIVLASQKPSVAPGAHVEVVLTLRNKTQEPLPLFFSGDPTPRFEIEALDAKGKRVDRPPGRPPGRADAKGRDAKAARLTLAAGGVARVRLGWEAVKTRWAPERLKGWEGRGYPTAPAGPLPRGKYTLRASVPLLGAFERGDLELPRTTVDVGG